MTKIDIFSGFLGAGKTTLIKKLIAEAYKGEKVVLIENEFGEIGIDGGFLRDAARDAARVFPGAAADDADGGLADLGTGRPRRDDDRFRGHPLAVWPRVRSCGRHAGRSAGCFYGDPCPDRFLLHDKKLAQRAGL